MMEDNEFFYLVWGADRFDSRVRHASFADAQREADRLAVVHPGTRFYVLQAKGFAIHKASTWTDCRHDPEIPW